ncbi:mechanosensitive ion channel family protein [Methanobrevibacter sp. YE315]|uniref:mechanosensitive ion channel family protein n=1 Tax=Methanobrevibacter sp. YE315 TaxID=1609968 RepID=UPI000836D2C2|nr:mechanosensitive ion channel domain-containing protein [Methanobrevibacter sp. YE315]
MNIPLLKNDPMVLVYILIIIIGTKITTKLFTDLMKRRKTYENDMTVAYLLKDIITCAIYFLSLMIILQFFGINLPGTLLSLGIVGIAVSFAAKDIISNLFSGIILILGKSIKVGDTIETDGKKGTVEKISIRTTTIIDTLGIKAHIPNSILTNAGYLEFRSDELRRVDLIVGLPLNVDAVEFREYIIKRIESYDELSKNPRPYVYAKEASFIQIKVKVSFWVKDYDGEDRRRLIIADRDKYAVVIANEIRKYIYMGEKDDQNHSRRNTKTER